LNRGQGRGTLGEGWVSRTVAKGWTKKSKESKDGTDEKVWAKSGGSEGRRAIGRGKKRTLLKQIGTA